MTHDSCGEIAMDVAVVQWLGRVWLFATPWTAARQASLSFSISQSLLRLMSIELIMPSNHLILCRPLLQRHGKPANLWYFVTAAPAN